jgi:hypothetical protein
MNMCYSYHSDFACYFYGCEALSLILSNEHTLRVFENKMPRGIFGPEREEVTGGLSKLHNEELHNLCSLPSTFGNINSMSIRLVKHVASKGMLRNAYKI